MFIEAQDITIRQMHYSDDDFDLMAKWLSDPAVLQFYEGLSNSYCREKVIRKFGPRALGEDRVEACIFEFQKIPIGYIQFYELSESMKVEYEIVGSGNVYGIDLFIGETQYWNQGLGSVVVKKMINYLFQEKKAVKVFIDPQTRNHRAIRCYEKCGFKRLKIIPSHELFDSVLQDSLIMAISKEDYLDN